jgi:hypothetical protein
MDLPSNPTPVEGYGGQWLDTVIIQNGIYYGIIYRSSEQCIRCERQSYVRWFWDSICASCWHEDDVAPMENEIGWAKLGDPEYVAGNINVKEKERERERERQRQREKVKREWEEVRENERKRKKEGEK